MTHEIPRTPFALLSGSAGWGLRFPDDLREPGVSVVARGLRFDTPWGPTEHWQLLELDGSTTSDGHSRRVLNVFSHGWPLDRIDHGTHRRVAWVLSQAGVRKVLADSTCGALNRALLPRDFVLAADVIDFTQTLHSTLPGRFPYLCHGTQLFCPALARTLERMAREHWPAPGRVYGQASRLVVVHNWGPRFNTAAEARAYQLLGADAINQSIGAEATAMREIGVCFASASYVVSYESGVVGGAWEGLDSIHEDLAEPASRISLRTIARADLTEECGCSRHRAPRPPDYAVAAQLSS
jgi:5'-methylthioadenosine phosphorylase